MIDNMLVIDVHNHVFRYKKGVYGRYEQTPEMLIKRMDRNGIDKAIIFPGGSVGLEHEDFGAANDYIIEAVRKYPDRLLGFCLITPIHEKKFFLEEIERCAKEGLKGIKLLPHIHGNYPIDSKLLDPIMEKCSELNLLATTHSDFNHERCSPYQVVRLAKRFPTVYIIMAHFGMSSDCVHFVADIVNEVDNLILDTSDTPNLPEFVYVRSIRALPNRVVFGSDSPSLSPEVELKKIEVAEEYYGLTREEKKRILGENAQKVGLDFSLNS